MSGELRVGCQNTDRSSDLEVVPSLTNLWSIGKTAAVTDVLKSTLWANIFKPACPENCSYQQPIPDSKWWSVHPETGGL